MDMSQYMRDRPLRVDDLKASGPRVVTIEGFDDELYYDKPLAFLSDGTSLALNPTNCDKLGVWGLDSTKYVGKEMKVFVGPVPYKNEVVEGIIVEPISPPLPQQELRAQRLAMRAARRANGSGKQQNEPPKSSIEDDIQF